MHPTRPGRAMLALLSGSLLVSLSGAGASGADVDRLSVRAVAPPDLSSAVATLLLSTASDGPSADGAGDDGAGTQPSAANPSPRLPRCEYRDDRTRFGQVREWARTLLDTNLKLRRAYEPWDLVSVSRAGIRGSGMVRRRIIADLAALGADASKAGMPLAVRSAYRSYETQVATFASWVQRSGYQQALKFSARPGHSEHQLGTTVDFTTAPGVPLQTRFGDSPAGRWLASHGWRYGFIMSYPKGMKRVSCYGYEPWHFRYFGRDLARQIYESGQVPRRFLWEASESAPEAPDAAP